VELRQKFGLLTLIYVLSLAANLVMSAWCIVVYFDSAFRDFQSGAFQEQQIERVRQLLRRQREVLEERGNPSERAAQYRELQDQFSAILIPVQEELLGQGILALRAEIEQAAQRKDTVARRWLALRLGGRAGEVLPEEDQEAFSSLDMRLLQASNIFGGWRQDNVAAAAQTQGRVVTILIANTVGGAILCAVGIWCGRRWVMYPIRDLREATRQIGLGNFAYRIIPRSRDELGQLAEEVNEMSATVVAIQTQLVEQERLAAAGEMVTRLAHNIRNPLAGIRGLAEATTALHPDDLELVGCQQRITDTVDRFEKWLRDLQQSVTPLKLNLQPVRLAELVGGVMTALRPMFDRRGIRYVVEIDPAVSEVQLDSLHFEQALVALVTNAAQASEAGQEVRISASPLAEARGRWRLSVMDHGAGISAELKRKIFLPYFTTKPEGNGLGLAMANKVVRLHGGQLTVDSGPGRGSRFDAELPGLVAET